MYRLTDVTKTYTRGKEQVRALDGVNLSIDDGDYVAIQGQTGGGKSTLLQILGALDKPTKGGVELDGRDLARLNSAELGRVRAEQVGFVFQSFNLIPTLTARENVETGLAPLGTPALRRRSAAVEALDLVGLGDRLDHLPGELSGGQQQRVAIARALVKEPVVLLADEPTGALDEQTRDEIVSLLERAHHERNLTLVIVTHDSWVAKRADRRLHLKQGKVTEKTTEEGLRAVNDVPV